MNRAVLLVLVACRALWAEGTPVCCTVTEGRKVVVEERRCGQDLRACCEGRGRRLVKASVGRCSGTDEETRPYLSSTEVCFAPTNFADLGPPKVGEALDKVSDRLDIQHAWIRTPHEEAGQGPGKPVPNLTVWADHAGRGDEAGSVCFPVVGCDTQCVEDRIVVGKGTGLYGLGNTCQDVVVRTLNACGCYDSCVERSPTSPNRCARWAWPPLGHSYVPRIEGSIRNRS